MRDEMNTASTAIAQSVNQVDRSMRVAESSESGVTESGGAPTTPTDGDSTSDTAAQVESSAGNAGEATPCRWCGTAAGFCLPRFVCDGGGHETLCPPLCLCKNARMAISGTSVSVELQSGRLATEEISGSVPVLFLGERPSPLAALRNWRWKDGRLREYTPARRACSRLGPGAGPFRQPVGHPWPGPNTGGAAFGTGDPGTPTGKHDHRARSIGRANAAARTGPASVYGSPCCSRPYP